MKIKAVHIINNGGRDGYSIAAIKADGIWESCELEIPDCFIYGYNVMDEPILEIDGQRFALGSALHSWGGEPCIEWMDGAKHKRMMISSLPDYAAKLKEGVSK